MTGDQRKKKAMQRMLQIGLKTPPCADKADALAALENIRQIIDPKHEQSMVAHFDALESDEGKGRGKASGVHECR